MGAVLDRNGLRPSRYYITDDGRLILSSEVGVLDIPQEHVIRKDRLRPGKMLLVDTVKGELVDDEHLKAEYASRQPYGEWLDRNLVNLSDLTVPNRKIPSYTREEMVRLQKAFGYRYEDLKTIMLPMAKTARNPPARWAAILRWPFSATPARRCSSISSRCLRRLRTRPSTHCGERIVTSTTVYVGAQGNLLEEDAENCKVLKINNPILTETDLLKIKTMDVPGFQGGDRVHLLLQNTPAGKGHRPAVRGR